ncbi:MULTISPECIES: hypothetical protein [unclassified Streptomyces]|uniref:hypothetical protein n=1 Tax=unclassified Streptomyces TaxID=2593676 RepID=UPI003D8E9950
MPERTDNAIGDQNGLPVSDSTGTATQVSVDHRALLDAIAYDMFGAEGAPDLRPTAVRQLAHRTSASRDFLVRDPDTLAHTPRDHGAGREVSA